MGYGVLVYAILVVPNSANDIIVTHIVIPINLTAINYSPANPCVLTVLHL